MPEEGPAVALEDALGHLEELAHAAEQRSRGETSRAARSPTRYDARDVLVPLGTLLRTGDSEGIAESVERVRRAGATLGKAWNDAVRGELELACAEHIHAVDPRYLDLANYDFDYTLRARARLEARIVAATELGLELPAALLEGVSAADARLAPFIDGRDEA
jgi:hypothetical protein